MAKKISEDAKKLVQDTAAKDRAANQIECPVCNTLLAKRDGITHCNHVYHLDSEEWEELSLPTKDEEEEEGIGASLLVEVKDDEDEEEDDDAA